MTVWSGLGMNYGHHAPNNPYDLGGQIESDLALLKNIGVTSLRIAYPPYDAINLASSLALAQRALERGFSVVYGVTAAGRPVTASRWSSFKSYVVNTMAPWAQSLNNPNLQLSIGNEEELHVDGTSITATDIMADIAGGYGNAVKAAYTAGPISYETADTYRTTWHNYGTLGSLDFIGFNVYREINPNTSIATASQNLVSWFGNKGYVSEFSTPGGYPDLNDDAAWATNLQLRVALMQAAGVNRAFVFCFRDGGFGIPINSFGVMKSTGPRPALATLANATLLTFN